MKEVSFWQELEDLYYDNYPEEWKEETLFVWGKEFTNILDGKADAIERVMYEGEKVTTDYIERGKRKVWEVGRIYNVAKDGNRETLGEIMLTSIVPVQSGNTSILIFRVK